MALTLRRTQFWKPKEPFTNDTKHTLGSDSQELPSRIVLPPVFSASTGTIPLPDLQGSPQDEWDSSSRRSVVYPEKRFRKEYLRLGTVTGDLATAEGRARAGLFWTDWGAYAAEWLILRLRDETNVDVVAGVVDVLTSLGEESVVPILRALEKQPEAEKAASLLEALEWIDLSDNLPLARDVADKIKVYLSDEKYELREVAYYATRALPPAIATELLELSLTWEMSDLREFVASEIRDRNSE